jgi:hypothetical protein
MEGNGWCVLTALRRLLGRADEDFEHFSKIIRRQERETNLGLPKYETKILDNG